MSEEERLYHYTDARGLIGIIESGTLWATHAAYLNDATEVVYPAEFAKAELERRLRNLPDDGRLSDLFVDLMSQCDDLLDGTLRAFVVCFCRDGDLLSQWRGYGARGGGYAIGFQGPGLTDWATNCRADLVQVVYAKHNQRDLLRDILTGIEAVDPTSALSYAFAIARFYRTLVALKDISFKEENEWRAVVLEDSSGPLSDWCFRDGNQMLIPYLKVSEDENPPKLPIVSVTFGPTIHAEMNEQSIRMLLAANGYPDVEVRKSKVPLRF